MTGQVVQDAVIAVQVRNKIVKNNNLVDAGSGLEIQDLKLVGYDNWI